MESINVNTSTIINNVANNSAAREKAREFLSMNLTGDNLERLAHDRNGNIIPGKTNLQYIIDQCDLFVKQGGVEFDYNYHNISGCTKFNIPTSGTNIYRPLFPDDFPSKEGYKHVFEESISKIGPQIAVALSMTMERKIHKIPFRIDEIREIEENIFTNNVDQWYNYFSHTQFKSIAQTFNSNGLNLYDSNLFSTFLKDLEERLNLPEDFDTPSVQLQRELGIDPVEKDIVYALVAFQYIMGTMDNWFVGSAIDEHTRSSLRLTSNYRSLRSISSNVAHYMKFGMLFSGKDSST